MQVEYPNQRSPFAMKIEDRSPGETATQERCAHCKAWNLARNMNKLKEKDKAPFYSPANEWIMLAAKTEEREFVVDSGASMHMVSKKDLELSRIGDREDIEESDDGDDGHRRTACKKEEARVHVRELGLLVTGDASGKYTGSSFTWKTLRRILGIVIIGRVARNHVSSRKARKFIATHQIMYHSSYLVSPRVPLRSSTSPTSSSQETVTDTEIPATRKSEKASGDSSARGHSWHESTEIENPNQSDDEELQSGELQGVPDWLHE